MPVLLEIKELHPDYSWLRVAMETGYNDYQQLVKDFKQFAGTTPIHYYRKALIILNAD